MTSEGQNFTVRDAVATDVQAIVALNREVQAIHARIAPERFRSQVDDKALADHFAEKMALADNRFVLVMAEARAVAYAWFAIESVVATPLTFERRRLHWHHAVVAETWRGRGVGATLNQIAVNTGQATRCDEIVVDAWADNARAVKFFKKMGFKTERIYFAKPCAGASKTGGPSVA
jgi:diamine N-acetyltransferase